MYTVPLKYSEISDSTVSPHGMLSARKRSKGLSGYQPHDSQAISHHVVEAIRGNESITGVLNRRLMHTRRAIPTCESKYKGTCDVDLVHLILSQASKLGKLGCSASRCLNVSQALPKACESV